METTTLQLGRDASLHLAQRGAGPDVVLVHGALTTGVDWLGEPLDGIADMGRITVVDRPGHGFSRRPRLASTPRQQARLLRDGLRQAGTRRPILVAHSLGAMVVLAYAEQYPDELGAIVLISPLAFPEVRPVEQSIFGPRSLPIVGPALSSVMGAGPDRAILQAFHSLMFAPDQPPADWRDNYPWEWMLSEVAGVANGEDFNAASSFMPQSHIDVRSITVPTLILAGSKDSVVRPAGQANALARLLHHRACLKSTTAAT